MNAGPSLPCHRLHRACHGRPWARLAGTVILIMVASSAGAEETVVRWSQKLVRGDDPGPSVAVFADGRVTAHIPPFLQGAGDFELRLEPDELDLLTDQVARLLSFDADTVRRAKETRWRELRQQRESIPTLSGAAMSLFELSLLGDHIEIRWRDPAFDARHLDSADLQLLASLEARLTALSRDPRRRPVEAP